MRKMIVALLLIGVLAGCATVQKDWENAQRINTPEDYKKFLSEHPNSEFSRIAEGNIEKLEWDKALQSQTVEAYQAFLSSHPESEFSQTAKTSIEELEWHQTRQLNTIEAYQAFLSSHPESEFNRSAEVNMSEIVKKLEKQFKSCKSTKCSDSAFSQWENAVWQSTRDSGNRDKYSKYLLLFPNGKHISLANKKIDDIDWRFCEERQDIKSCQKYLSTHKKGIHRKEAKQIIIDNKYKAVKQKNTVEAYDEFIKSHRGHEGALAKRRQLLYSKAVESGSLDDWVTFRKKSKVSYYKRKKWNQSSQSAYEQMMTNAETEIERLLYEKAIANPTLKNYRKYLKEFPEGSHKQQIIVLMEPLFLKEARSANTVESYSKYLKQYPIGFSSDNARALLDPVLWAETKNKNNRASYENYIKKFPGGSHAEDAEKKIAWMKSNPAIPKISYPKKIIASGYNSTFSWVTKFSEKSGRAGYYVSGSGWVIDSKGNKYGPNGYKGSRGKVTIKPGGKSQDDHWVRGDTFCGGRLEYDWTGEDTNGHRVHLEERINLVCE